MGFFAEKGGTGKSTLCHTAASYLRNLANKDALPAEEDRFRILAIDADPQNNLSVFNTPPAILSRYTDPGPRDRRYPNVGPDGHYRVTINDLLSGQFWPNENRISGKFHCNGVDKYDTVLGCEVPNSTEKQLLDQLNPESRIVDTIKKIIDRVASLSEQYDAILIDFNPTYSAVNRILLACCDVVFNVVTLDLMCIQAFPKLHENLQEVCQLRERLSENSQFLASKGVLRCFVVPNMVRLQAQLRGQPFVVQPIQIHALCIDRMKRGLNGLRRGRHPPTFTLEMATEIIPRCDNLLSFIHTIASDDGRSGKRAAQAFWAFVDKVRDLVVTAIQIVQGDPVPAEPTNHLAQQWTWTPLDPSTYVDRRCAPGNLFLYCIEFPDSYKIGKSVFFTDRHRTLTQMAARRLAIPVPATVRFLYESDSRSITSVESILHQYLRPTRTKFNEYYHKMHPTTGKVNRNLLEIIELMRESQDGQSNDFYLELACNELKAGRAAYRRRRQPPSGQPAAASSLAAVVPPSVASSSAAKS